MRVTRKMRGVASLLAIAFSSALALGGCATEGPIALDGIEQRAMNARTESDHLELAAAYEQQAGRDQGSSENHRQLALAYATSWSPLVPWSHATVRGPIGNTVSGNTVLVGHCENLANLHARASSANLELAAAHRQASAGATK
jgi:hypothetical protein